MPGKQSFISRHWPGLALLALFLLITLFSYKDYGVAWDEHVQRGVGWANYDYAFKGDTTLLHFEDKEYGAGYELILAAAERNIRMDSRSIFLMRHVVTHVFFLLCVFCGYVLVQRLFRNELLSCLGFILLACHPRIYAHSFFNPKDIPFLGVFLVALLAAHIAFRNNRPGWYILLGAVCGYATNIRILGVMLIALFSGLLVIDALFAIADRRKPGKASAHLLLFFGAACLTLYATWPLLWRHPVAHFRGAVDKLSHFPWNGTVLFGGKTYLATALPWFYLPGWFCITTPVLWLLCGAAGIVLLVASFLRNPMRYIRNTPERNFLIYLVCFIAPVLSVIVLHSVVYDDWRHVFFIYPSFVLLCLYAISRIPAGKIRLAAYAACIAQIVATGIFMVQSHPFQQVYFNNLVSHRDEYLRKNYELEYWGCSYKQGLDYLLAHDTSATIKIQATILPLYNNIKLLTPDEQKRIQVVAEDQHPDYFITNFRTHPDDYNYPQVFYEIRELNSTIMRVYKLH